MTLSMSSATITELLSDGELITASRGGDGDAYAELYRRHQPAALAAARAISRSRSDAEDLVAEGFARVLKAIQNGGGPELSFRPYLLTAVRNTFYDRVRRQREEPTDAIEDNVNQALLDFADDSSDRALAAKAFAALPERWQMVLWHTEVEGRPAAEVAPLLGLAPNAVAALAYRAREGLRQAYLQAHLQEQQSLECQACAEDLGAYVRDGLSARDRRKVDDHLEDCAKCRALLGELQETNSTLRAALIPALVGVPAVAFLGNMSSTGVIGWYRRQPLQTQAAAGAGLGVAVVAAAVALILAAGGSPNKDEIQAASGNLETTTTTQYLAPTSTSLPTTTHTTPYTTLYPGVAPTIDTLATLPPIAPMPSYSVPTYTPIKPYVPKPYVPPKPAPAPNPRPTTTTRATPPPPPPVVNSSTTSSSTTTSTTTTLPPLTAAAISATGTQIAADGQTVTLTLTNSGGENGTALVTVPSPYTMTIAGFGGCASPCSVTVPGTGVRTQATNTVDVTINIPASEYDAIVATPLDVTLDTNQPIRVDLQRRATRRQSFDRIDISKVVNLTSSSDAAQRGAVLFSEGLLVWSGDTTPVITSGGSEIKATRTEVAGSVTYAYVESDPTTPVSIEGGNWGFIGFIPDVSTSSENSPDSVIVVRPDGGLNLGAGSSMPLTIPTTTNPANVKVMRVNLLGFGGSSTTTDDQITLEANGVPVQLPDPFVGDAKWSAWSSSQDSELASSVVIGTGGETSAQLALVAFGYDQAPKATSSTAAP